MGEHAGVHTTGTAVRDPERISRAGVISEAWRELGGGLAPLSNASGHPLARTVKLILDPLVVRPALHPRLADGLLSADAAEELRQRIRAARADLTATAGWFVELKRARRRAGITEGSPQDLYFQPCFELAKIHGDPGSTGTGDGMPAGADQRIARIADAAVAGLRPSDTELTVERLRDYLRDGADLDALSTAIRERWERGVDGALEDSSDAERSRRDAVAVALGGSATVGGVERLGDPTAERTAFADLVSAGAGAGRGRALRSPGAARALGLSERQQPTIPEIGSSASKRALPRPFDRSIFERLFASFAALAETRAADEAERVVSEEILRVSEAWQLAEESSRVVMLLAEEASRVLASPDGAAVSEVGLAATATHRRLRDRWEREAYVRRVRRLPARVEGVRSDAVGGELPHETRADVATAREAYLRRMWARLHGRELRGDPIAAGELRDTLDGVLRSVVMDHRHRLKRALGRDIREVA